MNMAPRNRFLRRLGVALAIGFGLALLATGAAILFPTAILNRDSGPIKGDVLVVLGGGWLERPKRAAELFKNDDAPKILLSGLGDCEQNRRYLLQAGVPRDAIEMECESHNTRENAEFTVKLLRQQKAHRVIIVTTWYHSRRALACFRHFAPEIEFYSRPSYYAWPRGDWKKEGVRRYIRAEYVKLLGYWVRYGVCPI